MLMLAHLPADSRTWSRAGSANSHPAMNCSPRSPAIWGRVPLNRRSTQRRSEETEYLMNNPAKQLAQSHDVAAKVAQILQGRSKLALERFGERVQKAGERQFAESTANPLSLWQSWATGAQYAVDFAQRSILLLDTLRQRGNNFVEHERQGLPPVLRFDYEIVMDGRTFKRPVNYALLRIVPPKGVTVDAKRRPYVIIDPRGGHGPGIGGFKDDSQVGVALNAGHPVYFVIFFPNPEPGQTLLDVCNAERDFVHRVRELHA